MCFGRKLWNSRLSDCCAKRKPEQGKTIGVTCFIAHDCRHLVRTSRCTVISCCLWLKLSCFSRLWTALFILQSSGLHRTLCKSTFSYLWHVTSLYNSLIRLRKSKLSLIFSVRSFSVLSGDPVVYLLLVFLSLFCLSSHGSNLWLFSL